MRSRNNAHIHPHRFVVSHALQLSALYKAQQLRLQPQRHLANFVQKQRSPVGRFDAPNASLYSPGKRARVCPNNSASSSASGIAAQLIATIGLRLRGESLCSASATSSLPEPVGPSISTGVKRGATRRTRRLTSSMHGALPTSVGSRSAKLGSATGASKPARMGTVFGAPAARLAVAVPRDAQIRLRL